MDIFHYHPDTGEFLGQGLADQDPRDGDNWLIPAHATTTEPPTALAGKARVWGGSSWTQVADHRGETWWDSEGKPVTIENLGNPATEGLSSTEPVSPPPEPPQPIPMLVATAMITIDGGELSGLGAAAGLAFGFQLSTGVFWMFFSGEMPDLNYAYTVSASEGRAAVTDRQLSYMEVTVTEGGSPVDPSELSIQIYRVG